MVKARHSITTLGDCGTEFPNKIITKYIGRFTLGYITWAPAGFEIFCGDIDGVYVLSSFADPNFIGFVQMIANGSCGAIDFGEFVAKAIEVISFSNGCSSQTPTPPFWKTPISADQSSTSDGGQDSPLVVSSREQNCATLPQSLSIFPIRSIAKSMRWIVMSNKSPAPAVFLYCLQPQLVSGQSRNR